MNKPQLIFRVHAVQRLFERHISIKKVSEAVRAGKIIEDYSAEMPEPSRLILGRQGRRLFHVVTSQNQETNTITIITVYIPDPQKWNRDFTRRRA